MLPGVQTLGASHSLSQGLEAGSHAAERLFDLWKLVVHNDLITSLPTVQ